MSSKTLIAALEHGSRSVDLAGWPALALATWCVLDPERFASELLGTQLHSMTMAAVASATFGQLEGHAQVRTAACMLMVAIFSNPCIALRNRIFILNTSSWQTTLCELFFVSATDSCMCPFQDISVLLYMALVCKSRPVWFNLAALGEAFVSYLRSQQQPLDTATENEKQLISDLQVSVATALHNALDLSHDHTCLLQNFLTERSSGTSHIVSDPRAARTMAITTTATNQDQSGIHSFLEKDLSRRLTAHLSIKLTGTMSRATAETSIHVLKRARRTWVLGDTM
eukprot:3446982-Amphidinium_carterae.1